MQNVPELMVSQAQMKRKEAKVEEAVTSKRELRRHGGHGAVEEPCAEKWRRGGQKGSVHSTW